MRQKFHMSISIEGMLNWNKRKKINFMHHDDGSKMTDAEARIYLAEALAEGKRVLPMAECEGFDYQKGCPGHPIV